MAPAPFSTLALRTAGRFGPRLFRWLFTDRRTGRIVIGQTPNAQLLLFVAACGARALAGRRGTTGTAIRTVQAGSLLVWALDEFLRGVNPARRIGGGLVVAATPFRRMLREPSERRTL